MKKILPLVLFVLVLVSLGSFSMVFGEMMTSSVGVTTGDVFRYDYTCYFNSNDPHATLPTSLSWINETKYFMISVTGVSASSINFETMLLDVNGSSHGGVCSMNVGTGIASISGYGGPNEVSSFYFMARNVGMMGKMFPSATTSPTINGTIMMNYMSGQRLANHFSTSTNQNGMTINSDYYFDHATGMMVQWRQETIQTSGTTQTNTTQMMNINSSSEWVIPEFPASIIATIFIVVASVSTIAFLGSTKIKRGILRLNF